jgi:hypothetical protein
MRELFLPSTGQSQYLGTLGAGLPKYDSADETTCPEVPSNDKRRELNDGYDVLA